MKKIYLLLLLLSTLLSSKVIVGETIQQFNLPDQFEIKQSIKKETKKIVFVFSKEKAHIVRNFLDTKNDDYLSSKDVLFVADVSKMPAIIRWFVLDKLDKHKYNILLIEDEKVAQNYLDETRRDKIMLVNINNFRVTGVDYFEQIYELENLIENK
jgi:hypothetical protein